MHGKHSRVLGRTLPLNSSATLLKMGLRVRQGPHVGLVYSTTSSRSLSWYSLRSASWPLVCTSKHSQSPPAIVSPDLDQQSLVNSSGANACHVLLGTRRAPRMLSLLRLVRQAACATHLCLSASRLKSTEGAALWPFWCGCSVSASFCGAHTENLLSVS